MVITGAVGVGKTTVAYEVRLRLKAAGLSHVLVDDEFGLFHPYATDDPSGEHVRTDALASLWRVYRRANIERVVLSRAIPDRQTLERIAAAIPGAALDLYWLTAPLAVIKERIHRRDVPTAYDWCVQRSLELLERWSEDPLDAKVVETASRSTAEIAEEIVLRSGWLQK
jgi:predicted kinase